MIRRAFIQMKFLSVRRHILSTGLSFDFMIYYYYYRHCVTSNELSFLDLSPDFLVNIFISQSENNKNVVSFEATH